MPKRIAPTQAQTRKLIAAAPLMGQIQFICEYMCALTKGNPIDGYTVHKIGNEQKDGAVYEIRFGFDGARVVKGRPQDVNGWIVRLPLNRWTSEAADLQWTAIEMAKAA